MKGLPTASLEKVDASRTAQQTFVEGALGLQTKLEFPYLTNLLDYGTNLTITSAELSMQVPTTTLSPNVPTLPALSVSLANGLNQPVGTYVASVPYLSAMSNLTGLDQGSYQWSVATYCQGVLSRSIPNNGMLLAPAATAASATVPASGPEVPSRVVLGGPQAGNNRLQLRLYLIQVK